MGWLVLAAGRSKRFNGDKLLAPVGGGLPTLIQHSLKSFLATQMPILVVTRPDHHGLHKLLEQLKIPYTKCVRADDGMGCSLAWGISQIPDQWTWVGVGLADMPLILPRTLLNLSSLARSDNIVVPQLQTGESKQSRGHPVIFGSDFYADLLALSGDQGAKSVLSRYAERIVSLPVRDIGVSSDVDSRDDLSHLSFN